MEDLPAGLVLLSAGGAGDGLPRGRPALLARVVLVQVLPPVGLDQVVALEDGLDDEVVLLVALVEEALLDDGELALEDAEEAGVHGGHADLLADLQVLVEEHLLPHRPPDVHAPQRHLRLLRLARGVQRGLHTDRLREGGRGGEEQGQLTEEHEVHEVVLAAVSIEHLILVEVDDRALLEDGL